MSVILYLIPISIALALVAVCGFFWTVRNDQYSDLDGDASRILNETDDVPLDETTRRALRGSTQHPPK